MNTQITITKDILNEKVPTNLIPKRITSATSLYVNIDINNQKGLLLYYSNPTWNLWYPHNIINLTFMSETDAFKDGITYKELIEQFESLFQKSEKNYSKEERKNDLASSYKKLYNLENVEIGEELEPLYELKYSKSTDIYTIYKQESFVLKSVSTPTKLLNNIEIPHAVVSLELPEKVNGIKLVNNIKEIVLTDKNKEIINKNIITDKNK